MLFDFISIDDIGNGVCSVTAFHNSLLGVLVKSTVPSWNYAFFMSASRTWFFGLTPREAVSDWFGCCGYSIPTIIDNSKYD